MAGYLSLSSTVSLTISKSQEELLLWHSILGHYDIVNTQGLIKHGDVVSKQPGSATCTIPMFRSCEAGKGKKVGYKSTNHHPNPKHTNVLKEGDLQPGGRVSTDQYEYRVKKLLPYTKGKEDPHKMLGGGAIFVDHASGFVKIYNQVSLGDIDTVFSKERYEYQAADVDVKIKEYHEDNGVYKSALFTEAVDKRHQSMTFSGVDAHG